MMDARATSRRIKQKLVTLAGVVSLGGLLWAGLARADDLWLDPETTSSPRGEEVWLHLRKGEQFKPVEERTLQKDRLVRFDAYFDRAKRRDLLAAGLEGQLPVAKLRPDTGEALVVMDRLARPITLPADKFNAYLTSEGQEAILALRARLGQSDQPGKEVYTRYLKVLLEDRDPAGATPSTLYKRRVDQRLEILLENDPGRLKPDRRLTVKVLFEGKPLAGAKVFAYGRQGNGTAEQTLTATTSAQGLAEFKLDQAGEWLVRLVHFRVPTERRPDSTASWESFWASYRFNAREAGPITASISPKDG